MPRDSARSRSVHLSIAALLCVVGVVGASHAAAQTGVQYGAQTGPAEPPSVEAGSAGLGAAPSQIPGTLADDFGSSILVGDTERLPLGSGGGATELVMPGEAQASGQSSMVPPGTMRTVLALAGVLALILGLAWVFKRVSRLSGGLAGAMGAGGRAPAGLVEVLARYPIGGRQTLVVLRFDRRVLLCAQAAGGKTGGAGLSTLCEITDPEEVASVLVKTRDESGDSIARTFERAIEEESLRYNSGRHAQNSQDHTGPTVRVPAGYAEMGERAGPLVRGVGGLLRGRARG